MKLWVLLVMIAAVGIAAYLGWGYIHPVPAGRTATAPSSAGCGAIPAGRGQFLFSDTLGNADRPITVYTYCSPTWNVSGPILIVIPGAGRSGSPSRDVWAPYADQYSALVVVPEFSLKYYPTDDMYNLGNVNNESGWVPKNEWTFMAVEHLFDEIRTRSNATSATYLLDGHSAGAQFVHRLATLLPEARFSRAVAANAGVYLLPTYSTPYAFGLKDSPLPESELPAVFAQKLIVMSGEKDTVRDSSLASFPLAEAQGKNRFERAKTYFATAQAEAAARNVPLDWEYHVVPGVGHDEAGMARASAPLLFNAS